MNLTIGFALTACIVGIAALILVSFWATNPKDSADESYLGVPTTLIGYPGSENVFAWHPVLMVGGFFVGQVLAINTWSIVPDHTAGKILHVLWQSAALACMIAGLTAVVKEKFNDKDPSLTTLHSWIGICGIVMFCINYLIGSFMALITSYLPSEAKLRSSVAWLTMHRFLGLSALSISAGTIFLGIMEEFGETGCDYNNLIANNGTSLIKADYNPAYLYQFIPKGCKIANGMGIAVLISVLFTIAAVIARNQVKDGGGESDIIVASQL